jgi:hypothetical protein
VYYPCNAGELTFNLPTSKRVTYSLLQVMKIP